MSSGTTRRTLLQTLGSGAIVGLTGCITAGGPPPTTTYPQPPEDGGKSTAGATVDGTGTTQINQPTTISESKTYGIEVRNELTVANFEATSELSGPQPAVVDVRVNTLDPDNRQTFFEKRVEVGVGESKTFSKAFTVTDGGTMYTISAVLQPFVQGGLSRNRNRKDGYTFSAGGKRMPKKDPITVSILSFNQDSKELYPVVGIDATEE